MSFLLPTRSEEAERPNNEARQLREYWLARGYIVNTAVSYVGVDKNGRAIFQIQTDMVNGLPQRRAG